jgi:hypothetical protein
VTDPRYAGIILATAPVLLKTRIKSGGKENKYGTKSMAGFQQSSATASVTTSSSTDFYVVTSIRLCVHILNASTIARWMIVLEVPFDKLFDFFFCSCFLSGYLPTHYSTPPIKSAIPIPFLGMPKDSLKFPKQSM